MKKILPLTLLLAACQGCEGYLNNTSEGAIVIGRPRVYSSKKATQMASEYAETDHISAQGDFEILIDKYYTTQGERCLIAARTKKAFDAVSATLDNYSQLMRPITQVKIIRPPKEGYLRYYGRDNLTFKGTPENDTEVAMALAISWYKNLPKKYQRVMEDLRIFSGERDTGEKSMPEDTVAFVAELIYGLLNQNIFIEGVPNEKFPGKELGYPFDLVANYRFSEAMDDSCTAAKIPRKLPQIVRLMGEQGFLSLAEQNYVEKEIRAYGRESNLSAMELSEARRQELLRDHQHILTWEEMSAACGSGETKKEKTLPEQKPEVKLPPIEAPKLQEQPEQKYSQPNYEQREERDLPLLKEPKKDSNFPQFDGEKIQI